MSVPYIKVRNYLLVEDGGVLKRKLTPTVLQILVSADLHASPVQIEQLVDAVEQMYYYPSTPMFLRSAELLANDCIQGWLQSRWLNSPTPDTSIIPASPYYDNY